MRYSHQRESVYKAVLRSPVHPTANMVYEQLKGELPRLSLGTVYRNLNQLSDAGRLKKIPLSDGGCRFDGTTREHSHVICTSCGKVADVTPPTLRAIEQDVERETAFTLTRCDVVLYGLCADCAGKERNEGYPMARPSEL